MYNYFDDVGELYEYLESCDLSLQYPTDMEDAIIGIVTIGEPRVLMDSCKCIEILEQRDGMSFEDAVEFFEYNTIRGSEYIENGPVFSTLIK